MINDNEIKCFLVLNPKYEINPIIVERTGNIRWESENKEVRQAAHDFMDLVKAKSVRTLEQLRGKVSDVYSRNDSWEVALCNTAIMFRDTLFDMIDINKLVLSRTGGKNGKK